MVQIISELSELVFKQAMVGLTLSRGMIRGNNEFYAQANEESVSEEGLKQDNEEQQTELTNYTLGANQTFSFSQGKVGSSSSSVLDHSGIKRSRQERRKRADTGDRDFVCGCGKDYLSYAALYTHSKINHGLVFQDRTKIRIVKNSWQIILTGHQPAISSVGGVEGYVGEITKLDTQIYDPKNTSGTSTGIYSATMLRKTQEASRKKSEEDVYNDSESEDKLDRMPSSSSSIIMSKGHNRGNPVANSQSGLSGFKLGSSSSITGIPQNQQGYRNAGASSSSHAGAKSVNQSRSSRSIAVRNSNPSNLAQVNQNYLKSYREGNAGNSKAEHDLFGGTNSGKPHHPAANSLTPAEAQALIKEKHYEFFELGFKEYLHDLAFFLDNFNLSNMEDMESQLKPPGWVGAPKQTPQDSLFDPCKPDIKECFPQQWFLKAETWTPVYMTMLNLIHRLKNSKETTNNRKYFEILTDPNLTCTQVLTLFLMMNYNFVSNQFFKEMALVICIMRSCLDKHGPDIYQRIMKKHYAEKGSFCETQSANLVPEYCDRFVKDSFQRFLLDPEQFEHLGFLNCIGIDPFRHTKLVMLIQYLGMWLHKMNLTDYELQLTKERESMFKGCSN